MATLNSHTADECCSIPLSADMLAGKLNEALSWNCPICEQEWRPTVHQGLDCSFRHWTPYCAVMVFGTYDV